MNSEKLKETLNRIPYGALLGAFLAYLAYDYYGFTTSPDSPLLQKRAQIETVKKDNETAQIKIKQAHDFFRTLDAKKDELRNLAQQLSDMKGTLSNDIDVPGFMKLAVTEAKKVGLSVLSLKPTEAKTKEYYTEQPFDMSFRGVFVQFLVFLDRMSNVQNIVRVANMDLRPVGSNTTKYVELEGVIQLKTYKYVGSSADEIAGKAAAAAKADSSDSKAAASSAGGKGGAAQSGGGK